MADKVRRVDYSPDEYISGVGGVLNAMEQGVYWMICSLIMSEGRPIENDERRLAGLCRIRPSEARRTIDRLVERSKIDLTETGELSANFVPWTVGACERLGWDEWSVLRQLVFERDNYTCRYCGTTDAPLECDHIFPISLGGSNEIANLATSCRPCNRSKAGKRLEDWECH